ncbi:DUF2470 domain-containing protein [Nocardioides sp. P86]|uniref:DUF2470 domain-containing protein n=1 Tax=Nocardioides sp. P86 TaxID=2939569 RepID=UPI00203D5B4B|nr:DUF2470 domain-containing protein [Nocardioides sp. P86]MCM3516519.1 DUF2470 domain-containing protein [Nocardioides sp. P86]
MTAGPGASGGGLGEDVVDAVLAHMNDDHAEDSLRIVRAHGYPAATSAEMTSVDAHGGTWHVVDATGEASLRVAWPGGPVTERAQLRREVVALHEAARAALGG